MAATHLADVSAWGQLHRADVAVRLSALLVSGAAATCGVTDLEVAAAALDEADHRAIASERGLFPRVPVDDAVLGRAIEVQELLIGMAVPLEALVVAAAAERAGLVVLHHDPAFDLIAAVTGQATEWVTPSGTAPEG